MTSRTERQQSREPSPNHPDIHEVLGVCGGYPVIRNTRIPVRILVELVRQNATLDDLAEWYSHISRNRIEGALAYYAAYPARVDEEIDRNERAWQEIVERNLALQGRPWPG